MTSIALSIGFVNRPKRLLLSTVAVLGLLVVAPAMAEKGSDDSGSRGSGSDGSKSAEGTDGPAYFGPTYAAAMKVPVSKSAASANAAPSSNVVIATPGVVPQLEIDPDALGSTGSFSAGPLVNGGTATATNAFFLSMGTNGRSCFTCHQPASGMSISVSNIAARSAASQSDPLFAPVDGSNCPGAVLRGDAFTSAHSLLLQKGLIRVFMPVPLQTSDINADSTPNPHAVEYTIKVLHDPNGCNTDPTYDQVVDATGTTRQIISIYRRPVMSGNLKFKTTTTANVADAPTDAVTGQPLQTDLTPGGFTAQQVLSGNIMWDGREPTFESQAKDATLGHAQATQAPTAAQVAQIVQFETRMFNGQEIDQSGSTTMDLTIAGANGGPTYLATSVAGTVPTTVFNIYDGYRNDTGAAPADALRDSILRGQEIFNTRTFVISNVAGHNNAAGIDNPVTGTCASCHSQLNAGSSRLPHSQRDIGIGGTAGGSNKVHNGPSPASDLPIFQVTCQPGFTTAFNGTTVQTNDPGLALITGRCADVGRFTVPVLRALASRAPYFHDGSAKDLKDVLEFYKQRFDVKLNGHDRDDLLNFLTAL